jgi:hypothetical protein
MTSAGSETLNATKNCRGLDCGSFCLVCFGGLNTKPREPRLKTKTLSARKTEAGGTYTHLIRLVRLLLAPKDSNAAQSQYSRTYKNCDSWFRDGGGIFLAALRFVVTALTTLLACVGPSQCGR